MINIVNYFYKIILKSIIFIRCGGLPLFRETATDFSAVLIISAVLAGVYFNSGGKPVNKTTVLSSEAQTASSSFSSRKNFLGFSILDNAAAFDNPSPLNKSPHLPTEH
ncbi:MAG: hypothetical protein HYW34_03510 [Candidatus Brennerbacteria bacterium]|nr:hypothetical protein [Candidatus Brennerbacteria bacterium]